MVKYCKALKLASSEFQHKVLFLLSFNTSDNLGLCFSVSPKWSHLKAILSHSSSCFPKHTAFNIVGILKSAECMKEWRRME